MSYIRRFSKKKEASCKRDKRYTYIGDKEIKKTRQEIYSGDEKNRKRAVIKETRGMYKKKEIHLKEKDIFVRDGARIKYKLMGVMVYF